MTPIEMWDVRLREKAVAKYYGGYGEIERGFCHHALEFLTGNEAECMYLAKASRGAGKGALWGRMLQYKSNEYIMGAGTVEADQADHWIQDMGLVFGQTYTIYDVRAIDGHKLIKLRNPPGDHDEWHGDWGDASPLWTSRLKRKLGMTEEDDNTFWMAFDDFCTVFRCLYVCHYYHERSTRWKRSKLHGMWSTGDDPEGGPPQLPKEAESEDPSVFDGAFRPDRLINKMARASLLLVHFVQFCVTLGP